MAFVNKSSSWPVYKTSRKEMSYCYFHLLCSKLVIQIFLIYCSIRRFKYNELIKHDSANEQKCVCVGGGGGIGSQRKRSNMEGGGLSVNVCSLRAGLGLPLIMTGP